MQIKIYTIQALEDTVSIQLEAICDSFSSLLWDVRYYECGQFEIYISASPENVAIFKIGKIIGRDDDAEHFGIIESVKLGTDEENGDYLTVSGRFLMSLLARRIIAYTLNFTSATSYGEIIQKAVYENCITTEFEGRLARVIPSLTLGDISGDCWEETTTMQISYENIMDWIYEICQLTGGTANIRLQETAANSGEYYMLFELTQGTDRSILQSENPAVIFSDAYNNLLSFTYSVDASNKSNYAYILGEGEGSERKRNVYFDGYSGYGSAEDAIIPSGLDRYEIYVDARDLSSTQTDDDGNSIEITNAEYYAMLRERGAEKLTETEVTSESEIAVDASQYVYNTDYFVGDYVTVQHTKFGLEQSKIQLAGMIESFDQNGRSLTPTFENIN